MPKAKAHEFIEWDDESPADAPSWPTGNLFLDWLVGIGGLPQGRVVECYGPESSGKSTLGLQTAANVWQSHGIPSVYLDYEDAFDPRYAKALGLSKEGLRLDQPETLEDGLEWLHDSLLDPSQRTALVIVDSVAAARTREDMSGGVDQRTAAMNRARIWAQNLATLTHKLNKAGTTLLLVNQLRDYIDMSGAFVPPGVKAMQPKTTTPGGRGIKFYASLRIEFTQSSEVKVERLNPLTLESEKVAVGKHVWLTVKKNKVAPPPWRKVRLQIRDGIGFDLADNLLDFAATHSIVERKSGVWVFPGELVGAPEPLRIAAMSGYSGDDVAAGLVRQRSDVCDRLAELVTKRLAAIEVEPDPLALSNIPLPSEVPDVPALTLED